MIAMQESQAPEVMQELRNLLPQQMSSPGSTVIGPSSCWTNEEIATARLVQIHRLLQNGWKAEGNGLLSKGAITLRPSSPIPIRQPGEYGYNPRTDAFALRLGATFIESGVWAGRYQLGEHIVNHLGQFVDQEACPECGSRNGEFRFKVLQWPNPNPFAKPWEQAFTYCRRCCTSDEVMDLKRPREAQTEQRAQRRRS